MNHGTSTAYLSHRCRCAECRRWRSHHQNRYRSDTAANGPRLVPAKLVQDHVAKLIASGWTQSQIARELGRSPASIWSLLYRRYGQGERRIRREIAATILALEPLPSLDDYADPVVVDRLIAGADWQSIGATRAERVAAAERLAWYWTPIRARQRADGMAEQACDGESLTSIERRFGLRAGRDFRKAPDAVAQRGAA